MPRVIKQTVKPVRDSKKEEIIQDLIDIFSKIGYKVRIEKGTFKGGFCLLRDQKLFLLNKNLEQDKKISILVKNIPETETQNIYIKPNIRELIDSESESDKDNNLFTKKQ